MGIGKWILGGVCAVGAVVAAPIVLPVAAAAGAAAAGAAATAGAAVAGAAATAGAAAAGAAATAGAAVAGAATTAAGVAASSAVGTAVVGGMTAVGTTVGAAAGTVGLTGLATVATGSGAAAVGTIATAGAVGAATTGYGAKKLLEAKDIVDNAETKYDAKKAVLDKEEKITNEGLKHLGNLKLQVWSGFKEFYETIEKIKNCKIIEGECKEENLRLSKEELDNLNAISFKAIELLNAGVGSLGAGALAGIAAYGGTMLLGTASTGTAIAGLSGVAATNATLAALGGGSLAAGGLGMAGGTVVLGGLVAAPALAIGGIFIAFKGNSSVDKALEVEKEVEEAIIKMDKSIELIDNIKITVDDVYKEIFLLNKKFEETVNELKNIVNNKEDFSLFTAKEQEVVKSSVLQVKILKNITTTDLLVQEGEEQKINTEGIDNALNKNNR